MYFFQITYSRQGESGNKITEQVTASSGLTYQKEISSLSPGFSYDLTVTAINDNLQSQEEKIKVTTGETSIMYLCFPIKLFPWNTLKMQKTFSLSNKKYYFIANKSF